VDSSTCIIKPWLLLIHLINSHLLFCLNVMNTFIKSAVVNYFIVVWTCPRFQ
jgi:hypothetical protein